MSKAPPSFQFYPQDWLVGTAHLSHSSKATFLLVLCFEWTHVDLRYDAAKLARMIGLNQDEFEEDWAEIEDKFTIDEDGYIRNEKLEDLRTTALALSEARRRAGAKGGSSKAIASAKQKPKQKPSRLKTEDRRQKTTNKEKKSAHKIDAFELLWTLVENKVAKGRARKHYEKAVEALESREEDPHEFLRQQWQTYQASPRGRSQYAWEPCSWLRDAHYDDDPETWQRGFSGQQTLDLVVDDQTDPFQPPGGPSDD